MSRAGLSEGSKEKHRSTAVWRYAPIPKARAKRNTTRARRSAPLGRIEPLRVTAPSDRRARRRNTDRQLFGDTRQSPKREQNETRHERVGARLLAELNL